MAAPFWFEVGVEERAMMLGEGIWAFQGERLGVDGLLQLIDKIRGRK